MPMSLTYAVPRGRIRSSAVATWVWVPHTALTRPSRWMPKAFFSLVSSQWKSTTRSGGSSVGAIVEQLIEHRERVLDLGHVRPALGVDDGHFGSVTGVEHAPAAAGHVRSRRS